jgi:hypothetical protein
VTTFRERDAEIARIEKMMRDDPRAYFADEPMQARYRELISKDPALRMTRQELEARANEGEATDKVLGGKSLVSMSGDELLAHREAQLKARDHGAAYRRLIADRDGGA